MSPAIRKNKMESTVRIGYSGSPHTPVIKIISPKQLNEDSDPKDELIRDFLYTSSVRDRNQLFYLYQAFDLDSPFKLATIAPLGYFNELQQLCSHIHLRVLSFDAVSECHEFYDTMKSRVTKESDKDVVIKAPANYSDYLKIKEFFDWVEQQPYVEKPR